MIFFFGGNDDNFYITEYGHSMPDGERIIPQRIRETYLLHIVISGTCHFSEFDVNAGEAFLISKNRIHDFRVAAGYEHFWFAFDGKAISSLLYLFGLPQNNHALLTVKDPGTVRSLLNSSFKKVSEINNEDFAKSTLCAILPFLKMKSDKCNDFSDVVRAKLFLERNFAAQITMQQTAEYVHLSEKHLCRKFKAAYGMPPQKYLLSLRLARAEMLLKTTSLSIKNISESVGYTSPQIFSQVYKTYFGYSPLSTPGHDVPPRKEHR